MSNSTGMTPLFAACAEGFPDIVQDLVNARANVNAARNTGATPLFKAAQAGHDEIVKILLSSGADIEVSSRSAHTTPLLLASFLGHTNVVKTLIAYGAGVEQEGIEEPIEAAKENGYPEIVYVLEHPFQYRECRTVN